PAAAIALPGMIKKLDFIAIGTNDLVQYTLAVDRNNDQLANLYDPLHPAVLKLLAQTIATATRAGRPVSLCGEMAGDTRYTGLLLEVREAVNAFDRSELLGHAKMLLRAVTREGILHGLGRLQSCSAALP